MFFFLPLTLSTNIQYHDPAIVSAGARKAAGNTPADRVLFALGSMVGCAVQVQVMSGAVYTGVLRSAVPTPEGAAVVLAMAYKKIPASGAQLRDELLHPCFVFLYWAR